MKKTIFSFSLLLLIAVSHPFPAFSQLKVFSNSKDNITDSLVSDKKLWSIVDDYFVKVGDAESPIYYNVKFSSDTIINNVNYSRVWRTYDKNKQQWSKIGFVREDSSGVYFMNNEMKEGLIYDFNVKPNEIIRINNPYLNLEEPIEAVVKSVTDTLISGKTRRKITLKNGWNATEVWIEGIGSLSGIIDSGLPLSLIVGSNPYLICYFDNETLEFSNPEYDSCFCYSNVFPMTWAPIGAKWHYTKPGTETDAFVSLTSVKDTVIQEKNVRVFEVMLNGSEFVSREYIHQNHDSIFYFNVYSNTFHLLYNFAADVGDTIIVHDKKFRPTPGFFSYYDSIQNFSYKLSAIDSLLIDGHWLRRQKIVGLNNDEWGFFNKVSDESYFLDRIGSLTYFFGTLNISYPEQSPVIIRCYKDSQISYYNPLWAHDCDFYSGISGKYVDNKVLIFPNPATSMVKIEFDNHEMEMHSLKLFNQNGQEIHLNDSQVNTGFFEINLDRLPGGLYLYQVRNLINGKISSGSFIKK